MKVLLIDDEAERGWQEVLEQVLTLEIFSISDLDSALEEVEKVEYELILLDLRFGEQDHNSRNIKDYGGYKILKTIKSNFYNVNFSTPIIVITATNKVWNIFSMLENGADSFYVKEHPDFANDIAFSRQNYSQLLDSVATLKIESIKRKEIWRSIIQIHELSQQSIENQNIRHRIEEKLKIGYGILFRRITEIEKQTLLFNKEVVAFIVFWSILEEISHSYYKRENEKDLEWILASNGEVLQSVDSDGTIKTKFSTIKDEFVKVDSKALTTTAYQINLSNQICGILRYQQNWTHHRVRSEFIDKLNRYRNKVDFIHSNTEVILKQKLIDNQGSIEAYQKCTSILSFIIDILHLPSA